jgi:hypothetical protein
VGRSSLNVKGAARNQNPTPPELDVLAPGALARIDTSEYFDTLTAGKVSS